MPYRLFAVCQLWCLTASEEAGYSDFLFEQFGSIANVVQFSFFLFTFCFGSFGFSLLPWSKRVYVVIATCKMVFFPCPQMMEVVFSQNVFDCAKHIIVIHTHTATYNLHAQALPQHAIITLHLVFIKTCNFVQQKM